MDVMRKTLDEVLKTLPDKVQIDNAEVRMLASTRAIGEALNSHDCGRSDTMCIGAAAISITGDRLNKYPHLSFLVSYYTSHGRLLTSEATPRASKIISSLANSFGLVLLGMVLFSIFFLLIMIPLVWCFEMLQHGDEIPIFTPAELKQETEAVGGETPLSAPTEPNTETGGRAGALQRSLTAKFETCKLLQSFGLAARWTLGVFLGSSFDMPRSPLASGMHPILTMVRQFVMLVASATVTAIFTQFAISSLTTPKLEDFTAADTVCTNKASTANTNFVARTKAEKRLHFEIFPCETRQDMFDKYFNEQRCNVIFYDDLLLRGELKRRQNQQPQDNWDLRLKRSGLGDEKLSFDPYGMWMNSSHSLYAVVNQKLIDVARDLKFRDETLSQYFKEDFADGSQTAGLESPSFWQDFFVGAVAIALSVLVGTSIIVYSRRKKLEEKIRDAPGHIGNPLVPHDQQVHNIHRLVVGFEHQRRRVSSVLETRGQETDALSAAEQGAAGHIAPAVRRLRRRAQRRTRRRVPPAAAAPADAAATASPAAVLTPEDAVPAQAASASQPDCSVS